MISLYFIIGRYQFHTHLLLLFHHFFSIIYGIQQLFAIKFNWKRKKSQIIIVKTYTVFVYEHITNRIIVNIFSIDINAIGSRWWSNCDSLQSYQVQWNRKRYKRQNALSIRPCSLSTIPNAIIDCSISSSSDVDFLLFSLCDFNSHLSILPTFNLFS